MEKDRKRHCWECLRRSLVCDFTRPECKRCTTSGRACPGYKETQPRRLRWLPPGRVKSRKAKRITNDDETTITATKNTTRLPSPCFELKTDVHMFFQSIEYFNARIYPGIFPVLRLGSNNGIYQITPKLFQNGMVRPDYVRLGMVCMALTHRMNQERDNPGLNTLATTFFHFRGLIIRSLNQDIGVAHKRTSNLVIAGILTLLIADSQQNESSFWRHHLQGAWRIIELRGGMRSLAESPGVEPLLLLISCITVMGDMTSPASDLVITPSHLEELDFVMEHYGSGPFAFQGIPTPLFAEIIKINYLRKRASKYILKGADNSGFTYDEAYEILNRIQSFYPEQWGQSKPSSKREEWILLAELHYAALVLYCIHSLQSISVLPQIPFLRSTCFSRGQRLQTLLKQAILSPTLKLFILWPLIVLGVEAVNGPISMRAFVREKLPEMSRYTGMLAPLSAKNVLERFWNSGETDWDSCFDRPHAFVMTPAVNVSKLR